MTYSHNRKAFLLICTIIVVVSYFDISIIKVSVGGGVLSTPKGVSVDTIAKSILICLYLYFFLMMYHSKNKEECGRLSYRCEFKKYLQRKFPFDTVDVSTYKALGYITNDAVGGNNITMSKYNYIRIIPKFCMTYKNITKAETEKEKEKEKNNIKYFIFIPRFVQGNKTVNFSGSIKLDINTECEWIRVCILSHLFFSIKEHAFFEYIFPFILGSSIPVILYFTTDVYSVYNKALSLF